MKHTEYIIPIGEDAQDYDEMFIGVIRRQPELVRCKDCKYWGMHKSLNVPWCFEMHIDKSEDGYCDCGKRSEE